MILLNNHLARNCLDKLTRRRMIPMVNRHFSRIPRMPNRCHSYEFTSILRMVETEARYFDLLTGLERYSHIRHCRIERDSVERKLKW